MSQNISYAMSINFAALHMQDICMYPTHTDVHAYYCQSTIILTCIMHKRSTHYLKFLNNLEHVQDVLGIYMHVLVITLSLDLGIRTYLPFVL